MAPNRDPDGADVAACKGCGAAIIWAEAKCRTCAGEGELAKRDGSLSPCTSCKGSGIVRVPLDARAPVYSLTGDGKAVRASSSFVTHFATCPKASQFSRKR